MVAAERALEEAEALVEAMIGAEVHLLEATKLDEALLAEATLAFARRHLRAAPARACAADRFCVRACCAATSTPQACNASCAAGGASQLASKCVESCSCREEAHWCHAIGEQKSRRRPVRRSTSSSAT